MPTTMIATAEAATSLRRLNQFRARSKRVASWRIFLTTLRAKNGERLGSGTRPRISHNCLSSWGSIVSCQLNYLQHRKLRPNKVLKIDTIFLGLQENLLAVEYELGGAFCARLLLRSGESARV